MIGHSRVNRCHSHFDNISNNVMKYIGRDIVFIGYLALKNLLVDFIIMTIMNQSIIE